MASATAAGAASSQPVRVVLRLRPFLPSEAGSAAAPCVSVIGGHPGGEVTVQIKDQRTRYTVPS
jgi:kinesin family protein 22